jgi:hypothetical protein
MTKTQRAVLTRWVIDLRSGTFTQNTGALCTDAGYCCLGVLGITNGAITLGSISADDYSYRFPKHDGEYYTSLGDYFTELTGLGRHWQSVLIRANDNEECTFSEIADLIDIAILDPFCLGWLT